MTLFSCLKSGLSGLYLVGIGIVVWQKGLADQVSIEDTVNSVRQMFPNSIDLAVTPALLGTNFVVTAVKIILLYKR